MGRLLPACRTKSPRAASNRNLNDHGTASFSQKACETLAVRPLVSKEFVTVAAALSAAPKRNVSQRRGYNSSYRIRPLLISSGFPRVISRITAATIPRTTIARIIVSGLNQVLLGAGVGVAVGGGAFFAANILRAYCRRCTVS